MAHPHGIILITCPDRPGLVATVADFIYRRNGNIVHSDQHTDSGAGRFYMRVEWELEGFELTREQITPAFERIATPFEMSWSLHFTDIPTRIGILVSQQDHCLWDVMLRQRAGELRADIPVIISNHPDLGPVAEKFNCAFEHVAVTKDTKSEAEARIKEHLDAHRVDLVVLARYMQILTEDFVAAYPSRIINVHHSFLPAFIGARPYHQAHARGVKIIGATSHYVTTDLDEGPIIEQEIARTSHRDSVQDLIRKGRDVEKIVLARALRLVLDHRVLVVGNKTVVFS